MNDEEIAKYEHQTRVEIVEEWMEMNDLVDQTLLPLGTDRNVRPIVAAILAVGKILLSKP